MLLTLETFMMNDCKKSTHRIWFTYTLSDILLNACKEIFLKDGLRKTKPDEVITV